MTETLRSCIIPEQDYSFISLDASQLELRVVAQLSQDPSMLEDLKAGDLHLATAIRVFGETDDEEEMEQRRYNAKQLNFAVLYGADAYKISEMAGIEEAEAEQLITLYFQTYSSLKTWISKVTTQAKEDGCVVNMFGRIRPLPELQSGSWKMRQKAEREAINTVVQGSAVDIVKLVGLFLRSVIDSRVRFILQVHDEWLLEVPDDLVEQTLEQCKLLKQFFPQYPFNAKVGRNYGSLKEVE